MNKISQPNPAMQVVACYGGFNGHYMNFQNGIIDQAKLLEKLSQFMKEMETIAPHLNKNVWPELRASSPASPTPISEGPARN